MTLLDRLGVEELVIGYDHGFGKDRSGDPDTLVAIGAGFVQFVLFRTNGPVWSLAVATLLVLMLCSALLTFAVTAAWMPVMKLCAAI